MLRKSTKFAVIKNVISSVAENKEKTRNITITCSPQNFY